MTVEPLLTPPQIARLLGISEPTVRAGLRSGEIDGIRIGRRWFSTETRLTAWQQRERYAAPVAEPLSRRRPTRHTSPTTNPVLAFKAAGYR